jgi:hypothetical protein
MGYKNMVHYWHFKKGFGSLDPFVKFWWPSRFFLQNCENHEFPSLTTSLFCLRSKICRWSLGLETYIKFKWAHLMPKSMPHIHLKWIQIFRGKTLPRPANGPTEIYKPYLEGLIGVTPKRLPRKKAP